MPIYDFSCATCEEHFDELQRFDAPPPPCPACGGDETARLLSPFLAPQLASGVRKYISTTPTCLPGSSPMDGTGTHA